MVLRALTLRRPARKDPEEEEANQANGKVGRSDKHTIPNADKAWSCAEA